MNVVATSPGAFERSVGLPANEADRLGVLVKSGARFLDTGCIISDEGDCPSSIKIVLSGWVAKYKSLPDGRRQMLGLAFSGDICDATALADEPIDHSVVALTPSKYAEIHRGDFLDLAGRSPQIMKALWCSERRAAAIQREWILNIGQRKAPERIAHLMCEIFAQLKLLHQVQDETCDFPLTQADIAEATGLTVVHVNRTLQGLRGAGMIELKDRHLHIRDARALRELAMFNPAYLYL